MYSEVVRRVTKNDFRFTVVMNREQVYAKVPVAALSRMTREDAVRIGRQLGADCVIFGRFFGLSGHSNRESWPQTVVSREVWRNPKGKEVVRYVEDVAEVVLSLPRGVGAVRARGAGHRDRQPPGLPARTWCTPRPAPCSPSTRRADPDNYFLYQPDVKQHDPDRAKAAEKAWKDRVGSWSVPEFMAHARKDHERTAYRSDYRGEFLGRTRDHPVFLGDLPPEGDLAVVALDGVWRPILSLLKDLDKAP